MPTPYLPPELWRTILQYAFPDEDEPILQLSLIGPLAESSWYYNSIVNEYWLRRPQEAIRLRQLEGHTAKKVSSSLSFAFVNDNKHNLETYAHEYYSFKHRNRAYVQGCLR